MKEKRDRRKKLADEKLGALGTTGLIRGMFANRLKEASTKITLENQKDKNASVVDQQLKNGFIGMIRRAPTTSKKRSIMKQRSKIKKKRRSSNRAQTKSTNNTPQTAHQFNTLSLQPENGLEEIQEIDPPPQNVKIKAFELRNQKIFDQYEPPKDIMYDPFYIEEQLETKNINLLDRKKSTFSSKISYKGQFQQRKKTKPVFLSSESKVSLAKKQTLASNISQGSSRKHQLHK